MMRVSDLPARASKRELPTILGGKFKLSPQERMQRREAQRVLHDNAVAAMTQICAIALGLEKGWSNNQRLRALEMIKQSVIPQRMEIEAETTHIEATFSDIAQAVGLLKKQYGTEAVSAAFSERRAEQIQEALTVLDLPPGTTPADAVTAGMMWLANRLGMPPRSEWDEIAVGMAEAKGAQHPLLRQLEEVFDAIDTIRNHLETRKPTDAIERLIAGSVAPDEDHAEEKSEITDPDD